MRYIIVILAILLAGCATKKRCESKYPPVISNDKEVIYVDRIVDNWKDTTIYVELPAHEIIMFKDIRDTLRMKGKFSESECYANEGKLHGSLNEGKRPVKVEYKIKEVEVEKTKIVKDVRVEIVETKFTPKWVLVLAWIGAIALGFAIYRAVIFIKRFF